MYGRIADKITPVFVFFLHRTMSLNQISPII